MPRRRKTKGGGWFTSDESGPGPVQSTTNWFSSWGSPKPAPPPPPPTTPLPEPIQDAVQESQKMAMTAGRRLKKHVGGYDIASGKSMRKLLGTAKGDTMLGGKRRRRRTHRRR